MINIISICFVNVVQMSGRLTTCQYFSNDPPVQIGKVFREDTCKTKTLLAPPQDPGSYKSLGYV